MKEASLRELNKNGLVLVLGPIDNFEDNMNKIATTLKSMPRIPSKGYVKIASDIRKLEILGSMEKTSEVSEKITSRGQAILGDFYKEAFSIVVDADSVEEKIANIMVRGGEDLVLSQNISSDLSAHTDDFKKLAAVGVLNAKFLNDAQDGNCDEKLAMENNDHGLVILASLVKTANPVAKSLAGAFGKPAASSGGGFFSGLGDKISGALGGKNTADSLSSSIASRGSATK